jgi:hypothetical protein
MRPVIRSILRINGDGNDRESKRSTHFGETFPERRIKGLRRRIMPALADQDEKILDLLNQLSPSGKKEAMRRLLRASEELDRIIDRNRPRIEAVARERGLDWNALTEDEREQLIDDVLHEQD